MPNGLRIEHFCDINPKAQSWLVLNLPVFMFVHIRLSVPLTRITDLVRNVLDERFILFYFLFILSLAVPNGLRRLRSDLLNISLALV